MVCKFLGPEITTVEPPELFVCRGGFKKCTLEQCTTCEKREEQPSTIPDWVACPHRGAEVDKIHAAGCGCDRGIYACAVKGRCLKKLPSGMTRVRLGRQLDAVTVCATECDEWR